MGMFDFIGKIGKGLTGLVAGGGSGAALGGIGSFLGLLGGFGQADRTNSLIQQLLQGLPPGYIKKLREAETGNIERGSEEARSRFIEELARYNRGEGGAVVRGLEGIETEKQRQLGSLGTALGVLQAQAKFESMQNLIPLLLQQSGIEFRGGSAVPNYLQFLFQPRDRRKRELPPVLPPGTTSASPVSGGYYTGGGRSLIP